MKSELMKGKRGLVMGVANDKSIAWGMAKALHEHGAEMAFTYQGDAFGKRVKPLAESIGASVLIDCDVSKEEDLDNVFATLKQEWGGPVSYTHLRAPRDGLLSRMPSSA